MYKTNYSDIYVSIIEKFISVVDNIFVNYLQTLIDSL